MVNNMEHNLQIIGSRVKELRSSLNLSQEQFGQKIGLTKSGVSNVEKGKSFMSQDVLSKIVSGFNGNLNYIINGTGEIFLNICENTHVLIKNDLPEINYKNWGKRLGQILAENKETPYAFSKRTGISENRIEKFILNSIDPTMEEINAIKRNVDVSVDELFYGQIVEKNSTQSENQLSAEEIARLRKLIN